MKRDPSSLIDWKRKLEEWSQSDLRIVQFCGIHDLSYFQFLYWKKKLSSHDFYNNNRLEKWKKIIHEWEAGELSQAAFCRQKNLSLGSFIRWRKKLYFGQVRKENKNRKWEDIIGAWKRSHLPPVEFCKQHNINLSTFKSKRSLLEGETSTMKSKQNKDKWDAIFEAWEKSGSSQIAFCKKMNLSFQTFSYQKKRSLQWKSKNFPLKKKEEKWNSLVSEWKKSGLSKTQFCREHDLDVKTFSRWERRNNPQGTTGQNREKQKYWEALMNEWKATDLSQAEFCRYKKIRKESFVYWKSIICPADKRRSIKDEKHWKPILESWQKSGMSASQFCREHHLNAQKLCYWKRLLFPTERLRREQKWHKIINEWSESGLSVTTFCQNKGLTSQAFLYWKKKCSLRTQL